MARRKKRKRLRKYRFHQLESLEKRELLAADFRNPANPWDVNADLGITALDALLVINEIARRHADDSASNRELGAREVGSTLPYWDVTGDNRVSALDALRVINFVSRNDGMPIPKLSEPSFASEFSFPIAVGQSEGTRTYRVEIDAMLNSTDENAVLDDVFNIYIVNPDDRSDTLLATEVEGEPVFSLVGNQPQVKPGLSRFDGEVLEIDLTSLAESDSAEIVFQYLNTDSDRGGRVSFRPLSNLVDTDAIPANPFAVSASSIKAGAEIDLSAFTEIDTIDVSAQNIRFDPVSQVFAAEVKLQAGDASTGSSVVLAFPGFPDGVELVNRSGVDSDGVPYLNMRPAIPSGGLARGLRTTRVPIEISNPLNQALNLQAKVLSAGANQSPSLPSLGPYSVMPGELLEIPLSDLDGDGDPLQYSIQSDVTLPRGELTADRMLRFTPRPGEEGAYEFRLVASDGVATASQVVSLEVTADPLTTTRYAGTIRNTDDEPLEGLRLTVGDLDVFTDANGEFVFETTADFSAESIEIHGDAFVSNELYPYMKKNLSFFLGEDHITGALNSVHRVIYLPILDVETTVPIETNGDTVVTNTNFPEAELVIDQGAAVDVNGNPLTGRIGFMEVPPDRTPRDLPPELLPNTIYAVYTTDMQGAEFEVPAKLSVPNKSGYAPGTEFDLWEVDPETQKFAIFGTGRVSDDGKMIEPVSGGAISAIGGNNGANWRVWVQRPGDFKFEKDDLDCGCTSCECKSPNVPLSSQANVSSGALVETHDLVTYQSAGQTRGLSLRYDSNRAAPSEIVKFSYKIIRKLVDLSGGGSTPSSVSRISANISLNDKGVTSSVGAIDETTGQESSAQWQIPSDVEVGQRVTASMRIPLEQRATGLYDYGLNVGLYQGRDASSVTGRSERATNTLANVNLRDSPFGAGWSLSGWQFIIEQGIDFRRPESGSVLLVDGSGSELVFRRDPQTGGYFSPVGDFSTLEKLTDGTFRRTMKNQSVYQFNVGRRLSTITDRNGNITEYLYSDNGRLDGIRDPAGLTTSFVYDGDFVSQIIDPAQRVTILDHDENGDLREITDPDQTSRHWSYDSQHRMTQEITKRGFTETTIYDPLSGRVTGGIRADETLVSLAPSETSSISSLTTQNPNETANLSSYVDANGNRQDYRLDAGGLVVARADSFGTRTLIERNDDSLVSRRTNARVFATAYKYDSVGNIIEIADAITGGADLATVEWVGTSGDWHDPNNWSTGIVPGPSDVVLVDVSDPASILTIQSNSVEVDRLVSNAYLSLDGVTFTVKGPTRFDGGLEIRNEAVLVAQGAIVSAQGDVTIDNGSLQASDASLLSFPTLSKFENNVLRLSGNSRFIANSLSTINDSQFFLASGAFFETPSTIKSYSTPREGSIGGGKTLFSVDGAGTRLDLSSLEMIDATFGTLGIGNQVIVAKNGGVIDLSSVKTLTGGGGSDDHLIIETESGGIIDLSSVETLQTGIEVELNGSQVGFPLLSNAHDVSFTVDDQQFHVPSLTHFLESSVTLRGADAVFAAESLIDVNDSQFVLTGGANYTLPPTITSYTTPREGSIGGGKTLFSVDGAGTRLDLSSLEMIDATFGTLGIGNQVIVAKNSGVIDLSSVKTLMGGGGSDDHLIIETESGGIIDLSSVETVNGLGKIEILSAGTIELGTSSLSNTTLLVNPAGALTADKLAIVAGSSTSASGEIDSNVVVSGELSNVSNLSLDVGGTLRLEESSKLTVGLSEVEVAQGAVSVSSSVTIAGILNVVIDESFQPAAGDRRTLLSYTSKTGDFDSVVGLDSVDGLELTLHTLADRIEVEVTAVPGEGEGEFVGPSLPENGSAEAEFVADSGAADGEGELVTDSANGESVDDPAPRPRRFTYDPVFSQMTSETDELGRLTLYEVDPNNGNVTKVTRVIGELDDPANGEDDDLVTLMTYGAFGLLDLYTDELERVTDYDYDSLGRLVKVTYAVGTDEEVFEEFEYDDAGNQTAVVDEEQNRTEFEYDAHNRLTKITEPDPDGDGPLTSPITTFTYDAAGNLETTTDAEQSTITNTYDRLDRLETTTDDQNNVTRYGYDRVGNLKSVTNPLQNTTKYEYDARNRLVSTTDPDGGVTKYEYDPDDNLSALTDPVGNQTQFRYDARDRLTEEIDPLGKSTVYEYDAVDNLVRKTDRNGRITSFVYDDVDRLVTETWIDADGTTVVNTINYAYDAASNLKSVTDEDSALAFDYDHRERVELVDNAGTPNAPNVVLNYAYDGVGNVLSVSDTINGVAGATTGYAYDSLNRIETIQQSGTDTSEKLVDFVYNQIGQYDLVRRYGSLDRSGPSVVTDYDYDNLNRLERISHDGEQGNIAFYDYEYDAASRIEQIESIDGIATHTYDDRNQLRSADYTDEALTDEFYTYDANGNRESSHRHGDAYETGDANRLTDDGTFSYDYDEEGNLILRTTEDGSTRRFTYDHRQRLTSVTDFDSDGTQTQLVEYVYDSLDRRIAKTVTSGSSPESIQFVYDGDDVVLDFEDGSLATRYLHGTGVDEVLAQEPTSGSIQWHLADHLGTTRDLVESDGESLQHFQFDAYGNILGKLDPFPTRYLFTGREYEPEIDLFYYRARFYDANLGSFISADPIGFDGLDANLFRYARNDPIHHRDPSGNIAPLIVARNILVLLDFANKLMDAKDLYQSFANPCNSFGNRAIRLGDFALSIGLPGGSVKWIRWASKPKWHSALGAMRGKRVGHTFKTHGRHNTHQLTKRAEGSGMAQGQWLDDEAAEKFIAEHLGELNNGAKTFELPPGLGRQILPNGTFVPAKKVRLVPSNSGVKTAFPMN